MDVAHAGGWTVPIAFSRVNYVPVRVTLSLTLDSDFPPDGTSSIIRGVKSYIDGLGIGEAISYQRLLVAILSIPGHTVAMALGRKAGTVVTGAGTVAELVTFHGRATVVTGTGTVASLTTLQGITSGTVTFLGQTLTGLDFSSDSDLDAVASTLQTALRATSETDLDQVEVAYDSTASAFVVTIPLDSDGEAISVSAAFTGDDSDELGLDTATMVDGVDAIRSGSITFLETDVTGLDFGSSTTYEGVAGVLQTALRGASIEGLDEVTAEYVNGAFAITVPLDGEGSPVEVSGAFTGETADELGLDAVTITPGKVTAASDLILNDRLTIQPSDVGITTT